MRVLLLAIVVVLGCFSIAQADWRWTGPAAGTIEELRPDRSNPNLWFAVNNGSLYRSTDGGQSWNTMTLRDVGHQGPAPGSAKGSSITVATSGARVIVLKRGNEISTEIWSSQDHGKTFQPVSSVPFTLTKVIAHPTDPRILYGAALIEFGIVASQDGGKHWSKFNNLPLPHDPHPGCQGPSLDESDVALSPFHPDTVFVSGTLGFRCGPESDEENFFLQSRDAGKTWQTLGTNGVRFHMDPAYPQRLYALDFVRDLKLLTRSGWTDISTQENLEEIISIPRHANELLALTFGPGLRSLRSTDSGRTWHALNLDLKGRVNILAARDDAFRGILGGTAGGGLYFRDERQNWTSANIGFRESVISDVQGSNGLLYGLEANNFLFSMPPNEGWRNLTFGIPGGAPFAMAVDPRDAAHVVILSKGVQVSKDGGSHWAQAKLDAGFLVVGQSAAIDPTNSKIVYVAKGNSFGLFKSLDGGNSFKTLSPRFSSRGFADISRIVVDPNDNRVVYFVVPFFGIYKSTNGGASVNLAVTGISPPCPQCESNPAIDLVPLAAKDTYLAVTMQGKIYRTTNATQQWDLIGQGPLKTSVTRLYAADGMGQHLYCLAGRHPKLFESLNGGSSWSNLTGQFVAGTEVFSLTDPRQVPLYAGTNHGVFVRQ